MHILLDEAMVLHSINLPMMHHIFLPSAHTALAVPAVAMVPPATIAGIAPVGQQIALGSPAVMASVKPAAASSMSVAVSSPASVTSVMQTAPLDSLNNLTNLLNNATPTIEQIVFNAAKIILVLGIAAYALSYGIRSVLRSDEKNR